MVKETDHILIARTDSIGDVVLTLPLAASIRKLLPGCRISFIGRTYTADLIRCCHAVDAFVNWDEASSQGADLLRSLQATAIIHALPDAELMRAAHAAGIPVRIATAGRWASWKYANHRVWFSRKRSDLHESQLNHSLLKPLGLVHTPALAEIAGLYQLTPRAELPAFASALLHDSFIKVILHPLSKGSAVNWGLDDFMALCHLLPADRFRIFISGTEAEGLRIRPSIPAALPHVIDMTGKLNLGEFITFIGKCDALVAASTGPLHISAALGLRAIGLYSPERPIHPGRWAPVGLRAEVITADAHPEAGHTLAISPARVARSLLVFSEEKEAQSRGKQRS